MRNKIYKLKEPTKKKIKLRNLLMIIVMLISIFAMIGVKVHFDKESSELPSFEKVSKVEVGMSKDEVFALLGQKPWSYYDSKGFCYRWKFMTPKGRDRFQATIKNNKVINFHTGDFHTGVNHTYYRTYKNNLK